MPAPGPQRSLRELAQQRRLAAHQPMDHVTLTWIEGNRPVDFDAAPSFPRPGQMLVPPASWFTDAQRADSNHGNRHNARVSLYATLLAEEYQLDAEDVAAAGAAGAVHRAAFAHLEGVDLRDADTDEHRRTDDLSPHRLSGKDEEVVGDDAGVKWKTPRTIISSGLPATVPGRDSPYARATVQSRLSAVPTRVMATLTTAARVTTPPERATL
ncbi:hypothetical protein ACGFMM_31520 [Streptomyces sp. NPDC048604]|uniref:hypothetical protein n=1 Tax=Streptomyces sp. NPDC048604 TaxID=3365578 RepID=UPI00371ACCA4